MWTDIERVKLLLFISRFSESIQFIHCANSMFIEEGLTLSLLFFFIKYRIFKPSHVRNWIGTIKMVFE